jgi:adenylate kinase
MLLVFIGPPGAGKGTQCKRLVEYLGIPHISTGELLRDAHDEKSPLGIMADGYMKAGKLVPDPLVMSIVGERLDQPDCRSGCLFDGFPRTIGQAESLDIYLRDRGTPLNLVLELQVDEKVLVERMIERAKIEHRPDDTPETIANRMQVYRSQTMPLLAYYSQRCLLRSIDGLGTPDEVFARIKAVVDAYQASSGSP